MALEYLVSKKYHEISMLAGEISGKVSKNGEEWMKYLTTAARLYRYPFEDQMLIYAQRPDATACATMKTWNDKKFCWVNRGAKGIALFDRESERPRLKYVFDVSDVHKLKWIGQAPYLWEIREEHKDAVLAWLEKIYGETNSNNSFEDKLIEIAERISEDYYRELLADMSYAKEGSFLEELDELNVGIRLRETLSASIAYTLLSRCGADMDIWKDELNFDYISEFNTAMALSVVGNATSEMCKPLLIEIGRAVADYDRQNARKRAEERTSGVQIDNTEKNPDKTLANVSEPRYNALKRESENEPPTETSINHIETEGAAYGTDIRNERRISDTQPDTEQRTGGTSDEVRSDAQKIPEGTPEGDLQRTADDGQTERALSGNTETGRGENGLYDQTDGESRGSGRGAESFRSDDVGADDEQHQERGGGNRTGGAGLQPLSSEQQNRDTKKPDSGENPLSGSFLQNLQSAQDGIYQQLDLFTMFAEQIDDAAKAMAEHDDSDRDVRKSSYVVDDTVTIEETENTLPEHAKVEETAQIDKSNAVNFHITDDTPGSGSLKEKFRGNMDAIRTLKKIEGESRTATPEEQKILYQYVGWGGLADVFDESKSAWAREYQELKSLLSDAEYASARESTLNAHYTQPLIINSIYEALENMGFEKGNVLEPAMGIGNFYGCLPEKMQDSRLYGVELDDITGRIAKQLYPNADIRITGFEKTDFPDDFFDIVIGNVPFGSYKVLDKRYDKHNFLVHDYFFAKSIDKVRQGGVIAMITSNGMSGGTFDKRDNKARRYIAQRCDLLGAIRLPSGVFEDAELPTDILFFQKRESLRDLTVDTPDWVHTTIIHESDHVKENGEVRHNVVSVNNYFLNHPEMILGKQEVVSGQFGPQLMCLPTEGSLQEKLKNAVSHIQGTIENTGFYELEEDTDATVIPADPDVKNYSFCIVDDKVYYRENSIMTPVDMSDSMLVRIKGMIRIRDCTQELINVQLNEYPDTVIKEKQAELNSLYDAFSKKYGLINSQTNKRAFNQDSSYCLLCSLEKMDEEGKFVGKADMFTKRTIKKAVVVTSVDTATEALAVSLAEKARVDLAFMSQLANKSEEEITKELSGVIFKNPVTDRWETADEYLSGNVRDKLETAKVYAENHPEYDVNVQALTRVQPKELDASEIEIRIGATWVKPEYFEDFMRDIFETPQHLFDKKIMGIQFSDVTGQWNVKGKNADHGNSLVNMTYGTSHRNAYQILEDSLNLKDSRVYDTIKEDGKEKRVLNKKETTLAAQKQDTIREAFKDWVFRDPKRRQDLVAKYNKLFNSTRPREYDGAHLKFPGMTPDIDLKPHQKSAVAHVLYGDNTLLAHCVGAGKTYEMTAAAMESRRLGLCQKSLFVVPNHLTEQWASDFLRLYPGANILAATKKDFEPARRKKFCSRIATGDYDAVIIGHSQFEKIPLSHERQAALIERQINEIELAIKQAKEDDGERYTIKQMERSRKGLEVRLAKLNDTSRKDDVVTFEQLGVDRLFVDESHFYKNLFLFTKMRNVAGIAQSEAQKSSDMFAKCQYLDEITNGKGVTFATGTPISNSMTELYTNMRYLQYNTLQRLGLGHFDSWASSFGETQTAIELAPEGTGYRAKTRFAKFFNLPELIALFKESADIQTADMLNLPVPEAEYENIVLKPSEYQKEMVLSLADRAEAVRNRLVEPHIDNMLKITNDGRKLALDQRLINGMLPDDNNSKASVCVRKAFEIWEQTKEQKSAQLIFCDLSTPKGDGTFNVYTDIKNKLMAKGVPESEIAFIHEANTETRKAELFGKVRSGQVRFLLGSTQKMGAGTNVQDRLIALHHLDVPWRPSDIEQQEGRILRQGNLNPKVKIFRYVTEGTFDSYSWQVIENKQKFISQIMTSKSPVRSCEDVDEAALTYAEVKALATGNPHIKEKMDLDIQVSKLKLMKANHASQKYRLEDNIMMHYPQKITAIKDHISGLEEDIQTAKANLPADKEQFLMEVGDKRYTEKKEAGAAIIEMCKGIKANSASVSIGRYAGFRMDVSFDILSHQFVMNLKGQLSHNLTIGPDSLGNITRINHVLESMPKQLAEMQTKLETVERQLETAKTEVAKPFAQEAELAQKLERLSALNALLNMDEKGDEGIDMDDEPEKPAADIPERKPSLREKIENFKAEAVGTKKQEKLNNRRDEMVL